jgi:hypothetical protein
MVDNIVQESEIEGKQTTSRKSSRGSTKNSKGKSILKLAQDLVAKECDII